MPGGTNAAWQALAGFVAIHLKLTIDVMKVVRAGDDPGGSPIEMKGTGVHTFRHQRMARFCPAVT